jgi:flagellin
VKLKIIAVALKNIMTSLQVGINTDSSNQIKFDTNFEFDLSALNGDIASDQSYAMINEFMTLLSEKSTMLGAVENRLQSAIESIEVNLENLTSSLSTIRDADIAEVSSEYIRQQILQQASATLMATANQSPSIALQLI